MVTPASERADDAIQPYLPWGPATDEFHLFTGPLSFVPNGGDALPTAPGRVTLLLRSGSHLNWCVDLEALDNGDREAWHRRAGATTSGDIAFDLHDCQTTIPAHALAVGRGFAYASKSAAPDATIEQVVAHLLNVPDVRPQTLIRGRHPNGQSIEWHGRRTIDAPPWQLTLDARPDLHDAYLEAKRSYTSVLTHTLSIRRLDGELFSADDAERILSDVHVGLSFPLGRWAAPILPISLSADGSVVASFWGAVHADTPGMDADRWWPEWHPEFLDDYLPRLIAAAEDPGERDRLWFWITSSLATSQKAYLEQRITTALAAIEYMAYVDEVLSGEKSEEEFRHKRDNAPKRIRRRLIKAEIRLGIDQVRCPELAAFAETENWDGPKAITRVRDEVVHLKDRRILDGPGSPLPNAARLASRYLDLLILHRLDFQGHTRDRTKLTGYEGESDPVPWAKGH